MIRKPTSLKLICILALLLLAVSGWCQNAPDKTAMLKQLAQATSAQLPNRASGVARANPKEAAELALDLIFYRWVSARSGIPCDVPNPDAIISELSRSLGDPVVEWSLGMFPTSGAGAASTKLPPNDDERVSLISDLRREYGKALDYEESSPVNAVAALKEAQTLCQKLRLGISEALVLKVLGDHYLYNMSRYRDAELCYRWAVMIFGPYDCVQCSAIVYDDYGFLNSRLGMASAAVQNYESAAQQWLKLSTQGPDRYKFLNLAGQEYMKAGVAQATTDSEKALELMNRALEHLWNCAYATKSYADFINNSISVAQVYRERGNVSKAQDLLAKARNAAKEQNDPLLIADVFEELARTYGAAGSATNAAEAERKRKEALEQAAQAGEIAAAKLEQAAPLSKDDRAAAVRSTRSGATAYSELKDYAKSTALWRRLAAAQKKAGQIEEYASSLRSLARALDMQEMHQESLEARLEAAVAVRTRNKTLARDIGLEMVQALVEAGDLTNALEAFRELVPIFEESGDVRGAAGILEGRGSLLAKHGNSKDAITDFAEARAVYLEQVGDPWAAAGASLKMAAAHISEKETAQARGVLESALQEIEKKNAQENLDNPSDPKRGELLMNLHRQLASVYVISGSSDEAVKLLKKARRYPWVTELVNAMRSDADPVIQQFAAGLDIIGGPPENVDSQTFPNSGRLWADTWAGFWNTCVVLEAQYSAAYNALPIDPLSLLKASQVIPKDSVVVTYMPTATATYAFTVGFGKYVCREIGVGSADLDAHIAKLRGVLKTFEESLSVGMPVSSDWTGTAFLQVRDPLSALYSQLIAPIKQDLAGARRVIFALPDDLSGLPMHALIVSETNGVPRFALEDFEVSYLSQGMMSDLVGRESRMVDSSSDRLAIFADPEGNLPGAVDEAKAIRSVYLNSQWYTGERATASNFLRECERAAVLHIAAHHVIDPNPARFELRLAPDGESDGILGVEELSKLINSRIGLVVLSACDSISSSDPISTGPSRAAELFSMMGVKSVLGGLWKVSDAAAATLMADFYRNLSKGQSRTEALQRAQLNMIQSKKYAHPFYWACFALYGNPR